MTIFNLDTNVKVEGHSTLVSACNPCICNVPEPTSDSRYVLNVRWVNSGYDTAGVSLPRPSQYISSNSRLLLTSELMPSGPQVLLESLEGEKWSLGHQDIRLVLHGDRIHYLAGKSRNGTVQQVYGTYSLEGTHFLKNERALSPSFQNPWGITEKNWVFFPQDECLNIIHSWHPIKICCINGFKLQPVGTIQTPRSFKKFRGSSSMFTLNDYPAFIVHEVNKKPLGFLRRGKERLEYQHRVVILSKDGTSVLEYSEPFKFSRTNIEFCTSAINVKKDIVIAGSKMDKYCFLCRINQQKLINGLRWGKV